VPFGPGFTATLVVGGTDISLFIKDVKYNAARKEYDLPVLGGGTVRTLVGHVKSTIDIQGWLSSEIQAVFAPRMAETVPVAQTVVFRPQGAADGSRTGSGFVVDYMEHPPAEGPGEFTAKIGFDGTVTYA